MKTVFPARQQRFADNQKGIGLIEVLVTTVVMALGLLGYAALLTSSIKSNNTAYYRSQATFLAYDIIDRMRLNRTQAKSGSFSTQLGSTPSGTTISAQELIDWKTAIAQALPDGDGSVGVDLNGKATIVIQWYKDNDNNAATCTSPCSRFTTESLL